MCGVTALIQEKGNPVNPRLFRRMNNLLINRGPDESGTFISSNVALGSRRLSIIDLKSGRQPITNEDRSLVIVFNGEIYNYKTLRKSLERFHRFKTDSDTEVVLHLFEDKGEDTPKYLDGMFAFLIYNRATHTLFAARDHLGIKPLYYSLQNGIFIAASEPRSIIAHPQIRKSLDHQSLELLLLLEHIPSPFSIWQSVHKLLPGHILKYKKGALSSSEYWHPTFNPKSSASPSELLDALNSALSSAVARSLVADVPVGTFLSGGIDSSMITALVKKVHPRVHTFSVGFEDQSYDESPYSRLVAKYLGTSHHEQIFSEKKLLETIPTLSKHMDEPLADYSLLPSSLLAEFTRKYVKVALSGDGGDEMFGVYPTRWAQQVFPIWSSLPHPIKLAAGSLVNLLPTSSSNFSLKFIADKFISGHHNSHLREILWPGAFTPSEIPTLLSSNPRFTQSRLLSSLITPLNTLGSSDKSDQLSALSLRYYLSEQILAKVDRASMMHSLEVRPPFLSLPLVEFATKLPTNQKTTFLHTKILFKKLARHYLPKEIVQRPKKGFGIPMAKWLNSNLNPLMHELLEPTKLNKQGLFNSKYTSQLIKEHETQKKNNYKKLWTLMTFQLWYRNWFES